MLFRSLYLRLFFLSPNPLSLCAKPLYLRLNQRSAISLALASPRPVPVVVSPPPCKKYLGTLNFTMEAAMEDHREVGAPKWKETVCFKERKGILVHWSGTTHRDRRREEVKLKVLGIRPSNWETTSFISFIFLFRISFEFYHSFYCFSRFRFSLFTGRPRCQLQWVFLVLL